MVRNKVGFVPFGLGESTNFFGDKWLPREIFNI